MIAPAQRAAPQVSLGRVAAFLAIVTLTVAVAIWAKPILVPLVFAIVFALTLRPICGFYERYLRPKWLAIVATFITAALPIAGAIVLFTYQTVSVIDALPTITEEFQESINRIFLSFSERFDIELDVSGSDWVRKRIGDALDEPFVYVSGLVAGAGGLIGTLLLIFLYTFLLLLYRSPIYHFILGQFGHAGRRQIELVMLDTQRMSYTYLKGLGTVMLILGMLNSLGLMLIGIDYAFFWGFLAAFLAIIPYVGTFIGGLLPFLYALSTTDTTWQPVAVVALFTTVQTIEGNIITPKVVGASIRVNPLAAIIALFFGGFIWGVEGLILALPLTAILRIFLVHSTAFRPFGLLLSDDLAERDEEFLGNLDAPHYRVVNFFRPVAQATFDVNESVSVEGDLPDGRKVRADVGVDVDVELEVEEESPAAAHP